MKKMYCRRDDCANLRWRNRDTCKCHAKLALRDRIVSGMAESVYDDDRERASFELDVYDLSTQEIRWIMNDELGLDSCGISRRRGMEFQYMGYRDETNGQA